MKRTVLLVAVLLAGCSGRPRAPALDNESVYQNSQEGFRFVVPQGWAQSVKANLPPGPLKDEKLLVRYIGHSDTAQGTLEVAGVDLPESTNLAEYLAGPSHSTKSWKSAGGPEPAANSSATRFLFRGDGMMKEVVAFRRGERVYLFYSLYAAKDAKTREALRQAIDSIIWDK